MSWIAAILNVTYSGAPNALLQRYVKGFIKSEYAERRAQDLPFSSQMTEIIPANPLASHTSASNITSNSTITALLVRPGALQPKHLCSDAHTRTEIGRSKHKSV